MVSRHAEACAAKVHAAELAPTDYALVVGAATALRIMDRKSEAEHWYRQVNNNHTCFPPFILISALSII